MDTLHTKVNSLNQKFKSNAFTSSIVNVVILLLVLVFFSIGFDLTKKLLLDFIHLSWATIFPTIVDLITVAGLILILKKFTNILQSPDFFLQLDDKEIEENTAINENNPKIVEFLNNATFGKLILVMWSVICLFAFNCLSNIVLESINDQFSPLNEWYLLSSSFSHLPIFPINLGCIVILVAIILPTALNYAKYKLEITEVTNLQSQKNVSEEKLKINKSIVKQQLLEVKTYRFYIFLVLSLICIILSLMQRENVWIFQYNKPINKEKVLSEKLTGKASAFCEENLTFNKIHNQNVITATVSRTNSFYSNTTTTDYNYAITPELKQSLVLKCEKRAIEDKKILEQRKKESEKDIEQQS